ncbi:hypothetical protein STPYR_12673 [uncultured Stenotrophomonas sp.]|uniref:Uncharacterized protein n=1 Tax=uncultured Stenotrophomonas sp. TaxID=165438 RepID=A0A1Y5Q638_9GAMM|nr:hypothetical protein STPYR_12673 [uncultured Stenotrophomonas sp.]
MESFSYAGLPCFGTHLWTDIQYPHRLHRAGFPIEVHRSICDSHASLCFNCTFVRPS